MILSKNIIDLENGSYTFSDYFKMNIVPENLAKVFGYKFKISIIDFKKNELNTQLKEWVEEFHKDFFRLKERINLDSEMAKREFLVSPIINELIQNLDIKVDVETSIHYDKTLKGSIDYVLNNEENIFIAIEAKDTDMGRGLKQLMVELIAIDKIIEEESDFIYGAVTIGFDWNFVTLDRKNKIITQDINYIPIKDLEEIVQILVGILE